MNLYHSRIILITHRKFNQNKFSRFGGVHTHTDGHKKYIYINIYYIFSVAIYSFERASFFYLFSIHFEKRRNSSETFGVKIKFWTIFYKRFLYYIDIYLYIFFRQFCWNILYYQVSKMTKQCLFPVEIQFNWFFIK